MQKSLAESLVPSMKIPNSNEENNYTHMLEDVVGDQDLAGEICLENQPSPSPYVVADCQTAKEASVENQSSPSPYVIADYETAKDASVENQSIPSPYVLPLVNDGIIYREQMPSDSFSKFLPNCQIHGNVTINLNSKV